MGKNGSKILYSIQNAIQIPFHIFLAGLGIEALGKGMAKALVKHFGTYKDLEKASVSQLTLLELFVKSWAIQYLIPE